MSATDENATSSFDRTNAFATVPSHYLEKLLWLESDRMGFLTDALNSDVLDRARNRVLSAHREEHRIGYGPSNRRLYTLLFPTGHPYHRYVESDLDPLREASLAEIHAFHRQHYAPARTSLAIVGDFDPTTIKPMVEKWFGTLPKRVALRPRSVVTPRITRQKHEILKAVVEKRRIQMGWQSPTIYTEGDATADLLAKIIDQRGRVSAHQVSLQLASVFVMTTYGPASEIELELNDLSSTGPTENELARAKEAIRERHFIDSERLGARADRLNSYLRFTGDARFEARDLARYERSVADIRRFAATLTTDTRVVIITEPAR